MSNIRQIFALRGSCIALALYSSATLGAAQGDQAAQGEQVAERICTTCHRVPDEGGAPVGPPFTELAARGDWTAEQLQQILNNAEQHAEAVPASTLELDAVADYLNSLND